ncbi:CHAT domain-containing tetratricopeptide repeat protein [Gemmatimonas phototrophica]|uniref:CHAT domain-containing protein n=1 Tax=Gemmatimonas phototrophica TaxID=1379270 RepID=A0A143BI94_9BACT|nr:CHAT domain-containing protein [Gemmatimonas phototrophica]AMW04180.1 hypothetical protein GEMMAAP_03685 [Gemmatimonas phototrophica]
MRRTRTPSKTSFHLVAGRLSVAAWLAIAACDSGRDAVARAPLSAEQQRIDALLAAGDSLYRGAPDSAAVLWTQAQTLAERLADSSRIARALTGRAQAAKQRGEYVSARQWGEAALRLKRHLGMRHELFRSLNSLGLLAWEEDRTSDATRLLTEAATVARESGDSAGVAKARMNLGLVLQERALYDAAAEAFTEARLQFTTLADTVNLARTLNNLAALQIARGAALDATGLLREARTLASATGDSTLEVNARGQLATAYAAMGAPQRAFVLLDSANDLARRLGAAGELAENLRVQGDLYLEAGDTQHALDVYGQAAILNDSLGQPKEQFTVRRQQARALQQRGNVSAAQRMATTALNGHARHGLLYQMLEDLLLLAELAEEARDYPRADRHLAEARRVARQLDIPLAASQLALATARQMARASHWPGVLHELERTTSLFEMAGPDVRAERLAWKARAYAALGRRREAVREGKAAVATIEQVRAQYAAGELRQRYVAARARVYADLTLALLAQGLVDDAFAVADAARGRELTERLRESREALQRNGRRTTDPPLYVEREANALLARIDALVNRLRLQEDRAPRDRSAALVASTQELRDSLRVARSAYEALRSRLPLPNERHEIASTPATAFTTPQNVKPVLQRHEALVEYFATPEHLVIFAVTREAVRVATIPMPTDSLAARIGLVRELLGQRHAGQAAIPLLSALHETLVTPVQRLLPATVRQWVLVPHGLLTALPFGALYNAATQRHLVEEITLVNLPSAAFLVGVRTMPARPQPVWPSPSFSALAPFTDRLPGSRAEAEDAAAQSGGTVYLNGDASEQQLRTLVQQPGVVHVASHAVVNAHNPLFSRLELRGSATPTSSANDGRLEVHEILGLTVRSPLLFLSGCETAVGNGQGMRFEARGEFTSLANAWLMAGARNVVATLWRIDDAAAARFARHFHTARRRQSTPEALATAQRLMIRDPQQSHPYRWAAYQLSGDGR